MVVLGQDPGFLRLEDDDGFALRGGVDDDLRSRRAGSDQAHAFAGEITEGVFGRVAAGTLELGHAFDFRHLGQREDAGSEE